MNVNIVLAGTFAIVLTTGVLRLLNSWHLLEGMNKGFIVGLTFVLDMVFDIFLVFGLHWLAAHWPAKWKANKGLVNAAGKVVNAADRVMDAAPPPISFARDATIIQFQRLCLSPILYFIAWGLQWWMLHEGVRAEWTALPAYVTAIIVTRCIHTPWLLYSDRKVWEEWEAATRKRGADNAGLPVLPTVPVLKELTQKGASAALEQAHTAPGKPGAESATRAAADAPI